MAIAASIVLVAGGMTFANEWYQTHEVNWRVPIATALAAALIDGISHVSENAGITLSIMVLIAAATTRMNGKSPVETLAEVFRTTNNTRARARVKVA